MSKGLFITGTGTDIGKTYVTALLVKKLREYGCEAAYYKAAMSGNERREDGSLIPGDAACVKEISGIGQPLEEMCPYVYEHAYSPHLASRLEGDPVRMENVLAGYRTVAEKYEYITMEGSGGILCPLEYGEETIWLEDVIQRLALPCLIVADAGLGTINHVVLTVEYMRAHGMRVQGLILNNCHKANELEADNLRMCEARTGVPVLAKVHVGETDIQISKEDLCQLYL